MTVKQLINKVFLTEILKGMALTFKMMLSKPVTIQYPDEKRKIYPGFRGKHAFVRDAEDRQAKVHHVHEVRQYLPFSMHFAKKRKG